MKKNDQPDYQVTLERIAGIILLTYPTLMFSIKGGMNAALLSMLLLAFSVWVKRPIGIIKVIWKDEWTFYVAAMFAMTAAILISQAYHQNFVVRHFDGAARYWLAIPVFLLLYRLNLKTFSLLPFAFPVAAIVGWLMTDEVGAGRYGIDTLDLIHFGDFALILGVMSLLSINWMSEDKFTYRAIKILGFMAGGAASFASGSRGGWFSIPVVIAIVVYYWSDGKSFRKVAITSIAATLTLVIVFYSTNNQFQQRINQLVSETTSLNRGNQDTSIGIRWQLYKAAGEIFINHPLFGVGPGGFALQMAPMTAAGKITPIAADQGRGEVHNDILNKAVGMGLGGLIAILAVYIVPIWLFGRAAKSAGNQIKRAGVLGIVFVSGFIVFGLTVEILNLTMAIAFYSFTVAVLLAYCYNVHHAERGTT